MLGANLAAAAAAAAAATARRRRRRRRRGHDGSVGRHELRLYAVGQARVHAIRPRRRRRLDGRVGEEGLLPLRRRRGRRGLLRGGRRRGILAPLHLPLLPGLFRPFLGCEYRRHGRRRRGRRDRCHSTDLWLRLRRRLRLRLRLRRLSPGFRQCLLLLPHLLHHLLEGCHDDDIFVSLGGLVVFLSLPRR